MGAPARVCCLSVWLIECVVCVLMCVCVCVRVVGWLVVCVACLAQCACVCVVCVRVFVLCCVVCIRVVRVVCGWGLLRVSVRVRVIVVCVWLSERVWAVDWCVRACVCVCGSCLV